MPERLHPGVYVEERSGGIHPIEGVATSTAGFVGEAGRGISERAVFINDYTGYENQFGSFARDRAGLLAQAVDAFFRAGGRRAYVVRALPANAALAGTDEVETADAIPAIALEAAGRGLWANALSAVISNAPQAAGEAFRVEIFRTEAGTRRRVELFDNLRMDPEHERYFREVIDTESHLVRAIDAFGAHVAANPNVPPFPAEAPALRAAEVAPGASFDLREGTSFTVRLENVSDGSDAVEESVVIDVASVAALGGGAPQFRSERGARVVTLTSAQLRALVDAALGNDFVIPALATPARFVMPAAQNSNWDLQGQNVTVSFGPPGALTVVNIPVAAADLQQVTRAELLASLDGALEGSGVRVTLDAQANTITLEGPARAEPTTLAVAPAALAGALTFGTGGSLALEVRPALQSNRIVIANPGNDWDLTGQQVSLHIGPPAPGGRDVAVGLGNVADISQVTVAELAAALTAALANEPLTVVIGQNDLTIDGPSAVTAGGLAMTSGGVIAANVVATAGLAPAAYESLRMGIREAISPRTPAALRGLGFNAAARGYRAGSPLNPRARPVPTPGGQQLAFAGGTDGAGPVTVPDYQRAFTAFDEVDIQIFAMPGQNDPDSLSAAMAYVDRRDDCFAVLDGPGDVTPHFEVVPADAKQFVESLPARSRNAAIYYPWVQIPDPVGTGRTPRRWAPPSGFMAGLYASTDAERGVWKAPAGLEAQIPTSLDLQFKVRDADQDLLNPVSLNCLRQFPGTGIVSWGSRTLDAGAEWRYVPVRRTGIFIKSSLRRGLRWAVFEPNDAVLWGRIRTNIEAFMLSLFKQGAFQGTTPKEAFEVRCDRGTNPQVFVDQGIVTARVSFAPLKPAEFVVIEISQKTLLGT